MELLTTSLKVVAGLAVVGAVVETFVPGLISEKLQGDLTALTIGSLGILFSCLFLMIFLKLRIREGFEGSDAMTNWKQLVQYYKIDEVCQMYPRIYSKIMIVQKGAPPSVTSDAQARESTDKLFEDVMRTKPLSCKKFDSVNTAKNINTFFSNLYDLDNDFFVQAYETALGCRSLLIRQYNDLQAAEKRKAEGFQDSDTLCEKDVGEERRKMIKDKYLEAQKFLCKLPEELPDTRKEEFSKKKLATLASFLEAHKVKYDEKDTMKKILDDCAYYEGELEKKAREAKETSDKYDFKGAPKASFI